MASHPKMSGAECDFFRLVAEAAFSNPFADERGAVDWRILGEPPAGLDVATRIERVMGVVAERVRQLDETGRGAFPLFPAGDDREMLRVVFLFDAYHHYVDEFDRLIQKQVTGGEASMPVPFAGELLALLARRGFGDEDARRYLAIFYQLRRAYYFIARQLVGRSPCMKALRGRLWSNVFTRDVRWYDRMFWNRMEDFSTLLLGETGTGKGAAAAAIGRSGFIPYDGKRGVFVESFTRGFTAINLSQFPETLLESELFGHKKGAFTGAIEQHDGVLARCSAHGAIFLDEIGDVSIPVQIKLLQVLQERSFTPVGSHEPRRFRGRVIAATNRPLEELRRKGLFRDDFFYRLCSDEIVVPPLRRRLEEDPAEMHELLESLVGRLAGAASPGLAASIRESLERLPGREYAWPGNVRELEQAVRRIVLTGGYDGRRAEAETDECGRLLAGVEAGTFDAEGLLAAYCAMLHRRVGTYEEVARRTRLDRRTARKYVLAAENRSTRSSKGAAGM